MGETERKREKREANGGKGDTRGRKWGKMGGKEEEK